MITGEMAHCLGDARKGTEQRALTMAALEAQWPAVVDCGVFISGARHGARAVVVVDLALLDARSATDVISSPALASLLAYYRTVPRKAAVKNGLVLLVCGSPHALDKAYQLVDAAVAIHHHQVLLSRIFS